MREYHDAKKKKSQKNIQDYLRQVKGEMDEPCKKRRQRRIEKNNTVITEPRQLHVSAITLVYKKKGLWLLLWHFAKVAPLTPASRFSLSN